MTAEQQFGGTINKALPGADQLVRTESTVWGREVPAPTQELLDIWEAFNDIGLSIFRPLTIPSGTETFYWALIDSSSQPYPNDPLGEVLRLLREEKKVERYVKDPATSRFGLSTDEIQRIVLPEFIRFARYRDAKLGEALNVGKDRLRIPTETEFRLMFNRHPELLEEYNGEWLHNNFGRDHRLVVVKSQGRGLSVFPELGGFFRRKDLGFRLLLDFPSKQ